MSTAPMVSIIVVNWNGAAVLARCMESLSSQSYTDFDVILVDNGSTDGSIELAQSIATPYKLQVLHLADNQGFAAANNRGAARAQGRWLALLNSDAFPTDTWLEKMVGAAQRQTGDFFACRLIQANHPERLDGIGDAVHVSGLAWRRGHGCPVSEPVAQTRHEVFGPCAAAAMYPHDAFMEIGGFDESFFNYHEDVDLAFRLRLRGLHCWYVPEAVVHHIGSATHGPRSNFVIYHGHRNLVWSYVKNMPGYLFWVYLPAHLLVNLLFLAYYTLRGQGRAIWRAKLDAVRGLSKAFQLRQKIQSTRQISIHDLNHALDHGVLSPFLGARWRQDLT